METSAIDGTNVNEAFMKLITNVYNRLEKSNLLTRSSSRIMNSKNNHDGIDFQQNNNDNKQNKCC